MYPATLRDALISGKVVTSYVVDTLGRVPPGGAWIHSETHRMLGDAVCAHMKTARYLPAQLNGRRISIRVLNYPVEFSIR